MRISDWSSDVCSSVLIVSRQCTFRAPQRTSEGGGAFAGGIGLYADVGDDAPYLAVDLLIQIPQLLLRALKIGMPGTVALASCGGLCTDPGALCAELAYAGRVQSLTRLRASAALREPCSCG